MQRASQGMSYAKSLGFPGLKLSDIEREYVTATPEALQQIDVAIDEIVRTREHLAKLAEEAGLSLIGVRL